MLKPSRLPIMACECPFSGQPVIKALAIPPTARFVREFSARIPRNILGDQISNCGFLRPFHAVPANASTSH